MGSFSFHQGRGRALGLVRRLATGTRRGGQAGFALVELLVAILILSIAVGMATELYVSNLNSTNDINQRMQMNDYADYTKGWLASNLATADVPPAANAAGDEYWRSLVVTSPEGTCYKLSIDVAAAELEARQASNCTDVHSAAEVVLSSFVANTQSQPLFLYYNKNGGQVDPATSLATVRQVDVLLRLDNNDDNLPAVTREFSYVLGAFVRDNNFNGPIGTSDIQNGAVTNAKIAAGALTGDKFANGSIGAGKLTDSTRASSFRFPLISDSDEVWTAGSTTSWTQGPKDAFQRVGVTLGDYCAAGKTLEARGAFVAYNRTAQGLSLRFQLVRDNGAGGVASAFASSPVPGAANLPASGYALITTPWQTIDCATPETSVFFYSAQTRAGESGSQDKNFSLVHAALELRYR